CGLIGCLLTAAACSDRTAAAPAFAKATARPQPAAAPAAKAPSTDARPKVVILGDSLTAGLGLDQADAYPALLQGKIDAAHLKFEIVNAGVSGDTSAGGLRRLEWSLEPLARVLVLELGANDGLRGLPVAEMQSNLAQIVEAARKREIAVILTGMEAPPNYGAEYAAEFRQAYRDLAARYRLPFVPFLLDNVAGRAALNQTDGIH